MNGKTEHLLLSLSSLSKRFHCEVSPTEVGDFQIFNVISILCCFNSVQHRISLEKFYQYILYVSSVWRVVIESELEAVGNIVPNIVQHC